MNLVSIVKKPNGIPSNREDYIKGTLMSKKSSITGENGDVIVAKTPPTQNIFPFPIISEKINQQKLRVKSKRVGLEASLNFLLEEDKSLFGTGLYNVLTGHNKKVSDRKRSKAKSHWLWIEENDKKDSRFSSITNYLSDELDKVNSQNLSVDDLNERINSLDRVNDFFSNYSYFNKKMKDEKVTNLNGVDISKGEAFRKGLNEMKFRLESLLNVYKRKLDIISQIDEVRLANEFSVYLQNEIPNFKNSGLKITKEGRVESTKSFLGIRKLISNCWYDKENNQYNILDTTINIFNSIRFGNKINDINSFNLGSGCKPRLISFLKGGMPHSNIRFSYSHLVIGLN